MMIEQTTVSEGPDVPQSECFLCILDPKHTCHTQQLEGRLLVAVERQSKGERIPIVLLDTGTEQVEIRLEDHYYRSLVKEFNARKGHITHRSLKLRIYHLPEPPTTVTRGEKSRLHYKGNAYTLAVLEPDILLNITDLNQAEYCSRQYLLSRMIPTSTTAAMVRGNLVHYCFKELLKEDNRVRFNADANLLQADEQESPLQVMQRHLEEALQHNSIDIALADVSFATMREEVMPHLESLAHWYESERNTLWSIPGAIADDVQGPAGAEMTNNNQVRAETFLLAPEIGLRGRLDLFWQHAGQQRLLELKTGGATGELPRKEHRWQVLGYHALLAVRRNSRMKRAYATLLYSGTPGRAEAIGIRASIREIQRVNERRNILILSRVTGIPSAPPGARRCRKCSLLEHCQTISTFLDWQQPITEPDEHYNHQPAQDTDDGDDGAYTTPATLEQALRLVPQTASYDSPGQQVSREEDRQFFARYFHLLQWEGEAGEQQQAQLWVQPARERLNQGSAIQGLEMLGEPREENDGWRQEFRCTNTSELREGDEILLSDGDPITGEVVSGTIMSISSEQITIWTRELIAHPWLVDRYDSDLVHVRTLQNLMRWQNVPAHMRDLVAGRVHPRFIGEEVSPRADFNTEQNLAVARAMQMKDYLLIHGPPGTGKTSVIAEIVKRLVVRKERVMLAAFTNQAVDNMIKRLVKEGVHDILRLGSERSVDQAVKPYLLKARIEQALQEQSYSAEQYNDLVFDILQMTHIVASTTATWSSDRYAPKSSRTGGDALDNTSFLFDVAIIDEAGQLTLPAILGALRFARRFILVGDEKQLPPLVLSKQAADEGLNESLFSLLKKKDEDLQAKHAQEVNACVPLLTQYRMNKWISNFSSRVFYDEKLKAHKSIENRRIRYRSSAINKQESIHTTPDIERALDPRYPLVFLDIRDEVVADVKQSNAEARTVRELVRVLLARGIQPQEIGVIAPYRAQVANIRRHLFQADGTTGWEGLPSDTPLSVDTVDRFQGGERLVIIMSFATTQEPPQDSPRRDFLTNPNRLNVALTRAQCKLILIGCVPALQNLPTFSRLLTYCRSMHTIIEAQAGKQLTQVEILN